MIEMLQSYPMRMSLGDLYVEDESHCGLEVLFSIDDFGREATQNVPVWMLLELLGQAAECFFRASFDDGKRYLAQVNNFRLDPAIYQRLDDYFVAQVEITQVFGKMLKSHIMLTQNGEVYCEGDYVHCGV